MSLATEWKKEIADMSPNLKDKIINIPNKSSPRSLNRKKRTSLNRKKRGSSNRAFNHFNDIKQTICNNPSILFTIVFFTFYLTGWYAIFGMIPHAEHQSHNYSLASSLHPRGDITHHLPKQINKQMQQLMNLKELLQNKEDVQDILQSFLSNNQLNIKQKRLEVAISILVTRDPGIEGGFLDSAGALVISIEEANSIHNIHLIALVHKNVKYCLPILAAMGYEIRSYDTPFQIEDVENKKIGLEMKTDGCCGLLETLKLWVWTWNEFDIILSVDADVHFHQNFDELFELKTTLGWTHGATAHMNQELMNGGYLLVRPNITHFNDMIDLLKEGDFRDGTGWKGSKVGWVYGGRTIQGIVPYYYLKVAIGDETEYDRCKYNNMVEIEKCRKWKFEDVTSNHFTWCQKPWYCVTHQGQQLCDDFRAHWWERSHKFEIEKLGIDKPREVCTKRGKYKFIQYYESPIFLKYFKEHGYDTTPPDIPPEFFEKLKHKH